MSEAEDADFIREHLAEAGIFKKYGFSDKAWDQCVAVLERFPDNPEAKQLLLSLDWKSDARRRAFYKEITGRDWPNQE
jgi:hypothetical protein